VTADVLLLVDDDAGLRRGLGELLRAEGYEVHEAGDPTQAAARFRAEAPRVVVLDLMLPPSGTTREGELLLDAFVRERPSVKVVVLSGAGETQLALSLLSRGAYDFLQKPAAPEVLEAVIARAFARAHLEDRVATLERDLGALHPTGLLGQAPVFLEALRLAERAAPTDVPVLLRGATGTGKEVFSRHVHAKSRRSAGPFVALNCGALAPTLLEATLFGHKRGAFTGAVADAPGLFVEAHGGTLFLDEVGDLELELQVKLLRALESGEILPVGASKPTHVDVRLVSATHKDLDAMSRAGTFREDLFWRIRGLEITLPRLAERSGDLEVLAQHFLNQARAMVPRASAARLSPEALRVMENHPWPGNLRELRHEMQRALVLAAGREEILVEDLSPSLRRPHLPPTSEAAPPRTLEEMIADLERRELSAALAATGGNKSQAALRLGLSRQGLLNKLARHGLG
jgi:DNA-binding NtrC family response regulator